MAETKSTRRLLTASEIARAARLKKLFRAKQRNYSSDIPFLSQEKAGELLGYESGQSAVSQYLNAKVPINLEAAIQFSRLLGVSLQEIEPTWAADLDVVSGDPIRQQAHDFIPIRRYIVELAAGDGTANGVEDRGGDLIFRRDWLAGKGLTVANTTVVYARGESMAPCIQDGDILVVDQSDTEIKSERVYAFVQNGETRVKRIIRRYDDSLLLHSDNDSGAYPDEIVPAVDLQFLTIIGRVVWRGGSID